MLIQNKEGFYVYQNVEEQVSVVNNGRAFSKTRIVIRCEYFATIEDMFRAKRSYTFDVQQNFSNNINEWICNDYLDKDSWMYRAFRGGRRCTQKNCTNPNHDHCQKTWTMVVYDQNAKLVCVDRLVELYKQYRDARRSRRQRNDSGQHKGCHGHFRYIKTTQEHREWCKYFDDAAESDVGIKVRNSRSHKNLPTAWDDFYSRPQKSWKYQSKRKKQWRGK